MIREVKKVAFSCCCLLSVACHERYIDVSVSDKTVVAVKEDGRLEAFGCFAEGMDLPSGHFSEVDSVGYSFAAGVLKNGNIRMLLDLGYSEKPLVFDITGEYHSVVQPPFGTCALDLVDHLQCWRWHENDDEYISMDTSGLIGFSFALVVGTSEGVCGIVRDGRLVCLAYEERTDSFYQSQSVFPETTRFKLVAESSSGLHSGQSILFAISMENELHYQQHYWEGGDTWVTGSLGPMEDEIISMSAQDRNVCAVTERGDLLCWSYYSDMRPTLKRHHMWGPGPGDLAKVSVGWNNYCTISVHGELECPRFLDDESDLNAVENFCGYSQYYIGPPGARYHCTMDDTDQQCPDRF